MSVYKVAIVGLGPKGLFALERLLSNLYLRPGPQKMEIHLFEQSGNFGAGYIYDPLQPEYLLMNYANRNINVWSGEITIKLPIQTDSFSEWLAKRNDSSIAIVNDAFAPRAMVGQYLMECFQLLVAMGRSLCPIVTHKAKVIDTVSIAKKTCLFFQKKTAADRMHLEVDELLITTGHCSWKGALKRTRIAREHCTGQPIHIPFVYPLKSTVSAISNDAVVGIKGMGLTFIDTVLALTEGRGGYFTPGDFGTLVYHPSHQEPREIIPFSRSGLPMVPRASLEGKEYYHPVYFTYDKVIGQVSGHNKPSFKEHILPLYQLETTFRYYKVLFENFGRTLYPLDNADALLQQIEQFHQAFTEEPRFNFANLFHPLDLNNPSKKLAPLNYFKYVLGQADMGSKKSAFMAAAMTWGQIADTFNRIYSFGRMTPASYTEFEQKYRSQLNRISYGPPLKQMRKMIALAESGILNLSYSAGPSVEKVDQGWIFKIPNKPAITVDAFIDARMPTNSSLEDWSELLESMRQRGEVREFIMSDGQNSYSSSCPEMAPNGNVIIKNGSTNPRISLYGTLTEGITFDNDSLSRTRNNMASHWATGVMNRFGKLELKAKKMKKA